MRGSMCPSLHRLGLLLQATYSHEERIAAGKIDGPLLFLASCDVVRVHKLITRHRSLCAQCNMNEALRIMSGQARILPSNVVPFDTRLRNVCPVTRG
jgi:hypothetical protein